MSTRKAPEQVELNLAAMLDMAFQILTFFILTFKPSPNEGQVELRMAPPQPFVSKEGRSPPGVVDADVLRDLTSLPIVLIATDEGRLGRIRIGGQDVAVDPRLVQLKETLARLFGDRASPFDQVVIQVGSKMRYDELMRVLDVCTRQKLAGGGRLSKLSVIDDGSS